MNITLNNFLSKEYMATDVNECDYSRVEDYIGFAKAISRNIYQPIYIIDCCRERVLFASGNFPHLCGMTPDEFKENGNKLYLDFVSEDEQQMLLEIMGETLKLMFSFPEEGRKELVLSYFFSLINNRRRMVHHKITPLAFDSKGRIWLLLCTMSLSSQKKPGYTILRRDGDIDFYSYSMNKHTWYHKEGFTLSEMEHDILQLSSQGYTMKEIAGKLSKSEDSIKNYKRVLFGKLGAKSITEAVFEAINLNLLN